MSEIIVVRSLAESDLGIFSAHQRAIGSKQRAIGLTTPAARRLLDERLFSQGSSTLDCICVYGSIASREWRLLKKVGKNWRLGGRKLVGDEFAALDSKDFLLLRSHEGNDGSTPVLLTFVGRKGQRVKHAGLAALMEKRLHQSIAIFAEASAEFDQIAALFPLVPAQFAIGPGNPVAPRR
jgi:hypothetical protein